ncbi:MAG TPA: PRC-barrel domain-containing protein [Planctomycetota bacterium]
MGQTTFMRVRTSIVDASKIIGCKVENAKGESLGKIEDLMLDIVDGRIAYAVLSFGGFLGLGDKLFPVPFEALQYRAGDGKCVLNVDKDVLKNAPGYSRDELPDVNDRAWRTQIFSHYGYQPYWED